MEQTPPVPLVPFVPVMHRERFSELTGIPFGVIDGWVIRGYLPTILIGKHRLINLVELTQNCIEQQPR